jgi:hypothetical protein
LVVSSASNPGLRCQQELALLLPPGSQQEQLNSSCAGSSLGTGWVLRRRLWILAQRALATASGKYCSLGDESGAAVPFPAWAKLEGVPSVKRPAQWTRFSPVNCFGRGRSLRAKTPQLQLFLEHCSLALPGSEILHLTVLVPESHQRQLLDLV